MLRRAAVVVRSPAGRQQYHATGIRLKDAEIQQRSQVDQLLKGTSSSMNSVGTYVVLLTQLLLDLDWTIRIRRV